MLDRRSLAAAGAAAMVVSSLAACSGAGPTAGIAAGPGVVKVAIDGADQSFQGVPTCTTANGNVNIAAGGPPPAPVIGIVLSDTDPPVVHTVGITHVAGKDILWGDKADENVGVNAGTAQATRTGQTYTITGSTGAAANTSDPLKSVPTSYAVDVTCP